MAPGGGIAGFLVAFLVGLPAFATSAVYVDKARLADPAPMPDGDERAQYDHKTFEQAVGLHTIVEGRGAVIAIRQDVQLGDASWYQKVSIELAAPVSDLDASFGDGVAVRFVEGSSAFAFAPADKIAKNPSGRISIRRTADPDLVAIEFNLSFDVETGEPGAAPAPPVDCIGRGQARRAEREKLTPWFGAPVERRWKYSAIRSGKMPDAPFHFRCTDRRPRG